ncbi:hypothetical protein D3C75_955810 [compost metagenome]
MRAIEPDRKAGIATLCTSLPQRMLCRASNTRIRPKVSSTWSRWLRLYSACIRKRSISTPRPTASGTARRMARNRWPTSEVSHQAR